ncbi:pyridoxamine 5'-phosphate oxidase family protein [Novosphingopyxis sp.]|uniref:pyridoxamine 5'-phosphate oxidase family protein n=1 Tax=Novosphingopyxis sp. TaxID=2709690 RepID=UPI003B5B9E1E
MRRPDADPFHRGEHDAQWRAGVQLHGAPIRNWMSDQHREFFAQIPILFAAVPDETGWPIGTALTGSPGFVSSPDAQMLRVSSLPTSGDPAMTGLRVGALAGLLGIDLATRRRNRANGTVVALDGHGFTLGVRQSFGNCPQYIQAREVIGMQPDRPGVAGRLGALDSQARALIAGADTFFVASGSGAVGGDAGGLDMSHRGGRPGFVRVDGDVLTIPDFRGNRYFNTLGNLLLDPRAGLLFVDFSSGDLLQLQGQAELDWDGGGASGFAGAERLWKLRVTAAWRRPGALALRWTFKGYAPTTERTGRWSASTDG